MRQEHDGRHGNHPTRYRVVVEGELEASWAGWFESAWFHSEGGRTSFEVDLIDQAQLYAVLSRVHDLHLPVISVTRIGSNSAYT
jgi:hypothetical protein